VGCGAGGNHIAWPEEGGVMAEFLLELLCEEIPARMQAESADDLLAGFKKAMGDVDFDKESVRTYVTPRRLVLLVPNLPAATAAREEERKGPKVGSPDMAIQGFLKSTGLSKIEDAEIRKTDKGDFYFAVTKRPPEDMAQKLKHVITTMLLSFSWEKSMRWQGNFAWIRPLRSISAIFDGKPFAGVIQLGTTQINFTNAILGHRFMAGKDNIVATNFEDYRKQLYDAKVIIDREERKKIITDQIEALAKKAGLSLRPDLGLLDEVAGLVEWPVAMLGKIDPEFMTVPERVLITSMRQHQKYFALLNADGTLANQFAFVANIETKDEGKQVIAGNERVLRARLYDAKFFFEQDQKTTLESRLPKLQNIVFHQKLGTIGQKVERLCLLAPNIATAIGADPVLATDAATLCKADLVTGMVGEFPELQGYMGGEYARTGGENPAVATAIAQHYRPLGPGDAVPTEKLAITLALADKIDTLVGFFAANEKPTGSKDPFALRRAALGVIRLVLENNLRLDSLPLLQQSLALYVQQLELSADTKKLPLELLEFFYDRLRVYLKDQNIRPDIILAVTAGMQDGDLGRVVLAARELAGFLPTPDGQAVVAGYKRAANIIRAEIAKDKGDYSGNPDSRLCQQTAEIALGEWLENNHRALKAEAQAGSFPAALQKLLGLARLLDDFFAQILVNADDAELRANRLRLLNRARAAIDQIADFSKIEG
jgi:glycyl-tRNA synthetase beta chain